MSPEENNVIEEGQQEVKEAAAETWEKVEKALDSGKSQNPLKEAVDQAKDKAGNLLNDLKENEKVKAVQEKVEGVIKDLKENENVKAAQQKVEDTINDLKNNEGVKEAVSFVKEHADKAGDAIQDAVEEVQKSGLWQKFKGLFSK